MKKKSHEFSENFMQKNRKNPEFEGKNLKKSEICIYEWEYHCDINFTKLPFAYFFSIYLKKQ